MTSHNSSLIPRGTKRINNDPDAAETATPPPLAKKLCTSSPSERNEAFFKSTTKCMAPSIPLSKVERLPLTNKTNIEANKNASSSSTTPADESRTSFPSATPNNVAQVPLSRAEKMKATQDKYLGISDRRSEKLIPKMTGKQLVDREYNKLIFARQDTSDFDPVSYLKHARAGGDDNTSTKKRRHSENDNNYYDNVSQNTKRIKQSESAALLHRSMGRTHEDRLARKEQETRKKRNLEKPQTGKAQRRSNLSRPEEALARYAKVTEEKKVRNSEEKARLENEASDESTEERSARGNARKRNAEASHIGSGSSKKAGISIERPDPSPSSTVVDKTRKVGAIPKKVKRTLSRRSDVNRSDRSDERVKSNRAGKEEELSPTSTKKFSSSGQRKQEEVTEKTSIPSTPNRAVSGRRSSAAKPSTASATNVSVRTKPAIRAGTERLRPGEAASTTKPIVTDNSRSSTKTGQTGFPAAKIFTRPQQALSAFADIYSAIGQHEL